MVLEGSDTDDDEDAEIIQFQVGVLDPTPAKNHAWLCFPEKKVSACNGYIPIRKNPWILITALLDDRNLQLVKFSCY